jgi:ribosomal protein L9
MKNRLRNLFNLPIIKSIKLGEENYLIRKQKRKKSSKKESDRKKERREKREERREKRERE